MGDHLENAPVRGPVRVRHARDCTSSAPGQGVRVATYTSDAPPAVTRLRTLASWGACSLVLARPEHGRTHQIRAHLALAGHPIVGDKIYGSQGESWFLRRAAGGEQAAPLSELAWPRQCLHAWRIELPALDGLAAQTFSAPWPEDLPALPVAVARSLAVSSW